jgi:methionyl-tRNA formyltransferase
MTKTICIAGKNKCAVEVVKFILKKKYNKHFNILILPNNDDKAQNTKGWNISLKRYAQNKKLKIVKIEELYNIQNLILFSLEYSHILRTIKFKSDQLFNFHFSLLPKYRGCHPNYLQIKNGETVTGVTLHKIINGIDNGPIIDIKRFKLNQKHNAYQNYIKLMDCTVNLFKKNIKNIVEKKYIEKKQNEKKATYFNRNYVNYQKEKELSSSDLFALTQKQIFNKIKALLFPPLQNPYLDGKKIISVNFIKNKVKINFAKNLRNKKNYLYKNESVQIKNNFFGKNVEIINPANIFNSKIGDNVFIGPFTEIGNAIVGSNTRISSHSYICEKVKIGRDCFIGHSVCFINDKFSTYQRAKGNKKLYQETKIEDNVLIGSGSTILPVKISKGCVIGAGSVVTKDLLIKGKYAGNPAKIIEKK